LAVGVHLVGFPLAGGGGRQVHVNPEQVVCVMDVGERRTQIVTTGLSGETSMSLIVEATHPAVVKTLLGKRSDLDG
jgi:hypothetical protein